MVTFSSDRDILKYEPVLFGELHVPWQVLAKGTNATLSGTTLTDAAADFAGSGVGPGGVAYLSATGGELDGAYEIVSVDSATALTVSVLRADPADDAIAPPPASDVSYRIGTFAPQAGEAAFQLTEHFGIQPGNPTSPIAVEHIIDSEVLRRVSVFLVIASVYAMWAHRTESEGFWSKSLHYKQRFEKARQRCRLSIDLGSDGIAEITRIGGVTTLVRD